MRKGQVRSWSRGIQELKKGCSSDVEGIEQCKTDEKVFRRGLVGL